MESIRIGESKTTSVLQVTPTQLREIANLLEKSARVSTRGSSIIVPVSNSLSMMYNVPMREAVDSLPSVVIADLLTATATEMLNN
jgi:hypothetical protein